MKILIINEKKRFNCANICFLELYFISLFMVFWWERNGTIRLNMGPYHFGIWNFCQYNAKKMTDLQLFIIGCVLFTPVLLVLFTSLIEIQKPKEKNSNKPISFYINQIAFSVLMIGICVLLGIIIFKY